MTYMFFQWKIKFCLFVGLSFYYKLFIKDIDVVSLICPWEYMTFVIHDFYKSCYI